MCGCIIVKQLQQIHSTLSKMREKQTKICIIRHLALPLILILCNTDQTKLILYLNNSLQTDLGVTLALKLVNSRFTSDYQLQPTAFSSLLVSSQLRLLTHCSEQTAQMNILCNYKHSLFKEHHFH